MGQETAKIIAIRYDAEQREGRALAKRFGITGYPAFIVVDGNGRVIDEFSGYRRADELVARLRSLPRS